MKSRDVAQLVFAAVFALLVGCDSGTPYVEGSQDEVTVKGVAKVKGKAIPGAIIHFNASNSKRMVGTRDAEISDDGTFSVKAYVGQNIVSLSPPRKTRADKKNRAFYGLEYVEKYIEVKPGEDNQVDLDLTP